MKPAREELEQEKIRLENVENTIAQRNIEKENALAHRNNRLDEMHAAEEIQRIFRGFCGRRKARLRKRRRN